MSATVVCPWIYTSLACDRAWLLHYHKIQYIAAKMYTQMSTYIGIKLSEQPWVYHAVAVRGWNSLISGKHSMYSDGINIKEPCLTSTDKQIFSTQS